jgi:hypothetical protein
MTSLTERLRGLRGAAPFAPPPAAGPDPHAELRARRNALAEEVAELTWDLGGLTYEMAIRDHFRLKSSSAGPPRCRSATPSSERSSASSPPPTRASGGDCRSCGAPTAAAPPTAGSAASR